MLAVLTFETDDREEQDTISSIATGGTGGHAPPTVDRHGHRIRANPMKFFLGVGVVTTLPQTS